MMESESARVEREGGDANNMSVAVTRAFGDVDDRFGQYSFVSSRIFVSVFFVLAFFFHQRFRWHLLLMLSWQWQKRARPQRSALRLEPSVLRILAAVQR